MTQYYPNFWYLSVGEIAQIWGMSVKEALFMHNMHNISRILHNIYHVYASIKYFLQYSERFGYKNITNQSANLAINGSGALMPWRS